MKIIDSNYNVTCFGTLVMLIAAVLFLPMLGISLWVDMPNIVFKILGTSLLFGFFIAIVGLFIPHD